MVLRALKARLGAKASKNGQCSMFNEKSNRGVAQLVAHLVWDQVVARSSRVTPTFFCSIQKNNQSPHQEEATDLFFMVLLRTI